MSRFGQEGRILPVEHSRECLRGRSDLSLCYQISPWHSHRGFSAWLLPAPCASVSGKQVISHPKWNYLVVLVSLFLCKFDPWEIKKCNLFLFRLHRGHWGASCYSFIYHVSLECENSVTVPAYGWKITFLTFFLWKLRIPFEFVRHAFWRYFKNNPFPHFLT